MQDHLDHQLRFRFSVFVCSKLLNIQEIFDASQGDVREKNGNNRSIENQHKNLKSNLHFEIHKSRVRNYADGNVRKMKLQHVEFETVKTVKHGQLAGVSRDIHMRKMLFVLVCIVAFLSNISHLFYDCISCKLFVFLSRVHQNNKMQHDYVDSLPKCECGCGRLANSICYICCGWYCFGHCIAYVWLNGWYKTCIVCCSKKSIGRGDKCCWADCCFAKQLYSLTATLRMFTLDKELDANSQFGCTLL